MISPFVLCLSTHPNLGKAKKLAKTLVREKLAACVNLLPALHSLYSWEGKLCDSKEVLLLIKTRKKTCRKLQKRLEALHPYEVPEFIVLDIDQASQAYGSWLQDNTL